MSRDTIDVWVASIDRFGEDDLSILDDNERHRRHSYRDVGDAARFVAGALMVRYAIGSLAGTDPGEVRVSRVCRSCGGYHGAPLTDDTDLRIAVSHSDRLAAVAVGRSIGLGIDVERTADRFSKAVARRFLPDGDRLESADDFCRSWTRMEAASKAVGIGLNPRSARWKTEPPEGEGPFRYRTEDGVVSVLDFDPGPGYRGAVAIRASIMPSLRFHQKF